MIDLSKPEQRAKYWRLIVLDNNHYHQDFLRLILARITEKERECKEFENKNKVALNDVDQSGESLNDVLGGMYHDLDVISNTLFKSFTLSVLMYMEAKLLELCDHLQTELEQKINVRHLEGTGMRRSLKYLELVLNRPLIIDSDLLSDLKIIIIIRNVITHADGRILDEGELKQIKKYIARYPNHIELYEDKDIVLNEQFAKHLIALNDGVFKEITDNWLSKDF